MNPVNQLFFQGLTVGGRPMPMGNVGGGTYIEHINLDGPQLLLTVSDADSALRDNGGLVEGARLSVKMGDPGARGDAYFSSDFVVCSAEPEGDHLFIEAIEAGVFAAKQPAPAPIFFNALAASEILAKVFPGYKVEAPSKGKFTYHITSGATPSGVLRLLARDLGAAIWVARGVVYCIPFSLLMGRELKGDPIVFEYAGTQVLHPITAYSNMGVGNMTDRAVRRNYYCWDTVNGMVRGASNQDAPPAILTGVPQSALDSASRRLDPCLLADVMGNGLYAAGLPVGVRLHRVDRESVIDESTPAKQVIMTVSHTQSSNSYLCKVTTGVAR